jgi:hypothetical protein
VRTLALTIPFFVAALGAASAPSQPAPLTIRSTEPVVVYGEVVHISGVLRGGPEGTQVTLYLRRHGESTFSPVSVVVTVDRGAWSFAFEPTMRSSIEARLGEIASPTLTVRVRPRLTLKRRGEGLFARAVGARSFRGRHVWFQRRSSRGVWRSVTRVVLDDPPRRFEAGLPRGVSRVRVSLPRGQAGPGYEPAVSRSLLLRR